MLSSSLRRQLARLSWRGSLAGQQGQGRHRGRRRGKSMEFAEHRDYAPGDDLRHLDWNALARHEKLVVKEFESELERTALIVVDFSLSMQGPKAERAALVALALAWLWLRDQDRVALGILGASAYHPAVRGSASWGKLSHWLERPCQGRAGLVDQLQFLAARVPARSTLIVLSDWLEQEALQVIPRLAFYQHQVAALQILHPDEVEPPWSGPLRLIDCEDGQEQLQHLDPQARDSYRQALQEHSLSMQKACRQRGFLWSQHLCTEAADDLLTRHLVSQGWLT